MTYSLATCHQKFLKISNPLTRNFERHMHSGGAQAVHSCRQRHAYEHHSAQACDSRGRVAWGACRVLTIVEIDLLKTAPKACSRSTHALPGMIETAPCHRSLSRHFHANAPPHEADDNWLRPYSQSSQPQVCASPVGRLSVVSTIRALQTPSIKPSHAPMRHAFST